jgi:hypothetical protein
MTDKKTKGLAKTPAIKPRNPDAFRLTAATPEEQTRKGAELSTSGGVNAMLVRAYMPIDGIGAGDIHEAMVRQSEALQADGDRIHQAEAMLLNQAAALQAMFIDLASRAKAQNNREWIQTMTGLALRAQTNCTQTLKTLGELRSPNKPCLPNRPTLPTVTSKSTMVTSPSPAKRVSRAHKMPQLCRTNYWRTIMANGWTPERRARQAALIRTWKPWNRSTGPTTPEGKATTKRNAFKGGFRPQLRSLARRTNELIREMKAVGNWPPG